MASSSSGCVHRDKSKVIISIQLFEIRLIGRFSGVNTRFPFGTNVLLPNKDEESKTQDLKTVYSNKNN